MADWTYQQLALRRPQDRDEVVRRINSGWELVGLTTRGRGGHNVVHAILRVRRPADAQPVEANRRIVEAVR
jgi:hypothetical protein